MNMDAAAPTETKHRPWQLPDDSNFIENRYFPTQIFSYSLDDALAPSFNTALLEAIYAEREKDRKGIQRSNFQALGGWHSHNNLHKEQAFSEIVSLIDTCGAMVSSKNGYHDGYRLTIGMMWSIVNPPGSFNRAHIHPGCIWSGVYYVQAPEGSGDIECIDPRTENLIQPPRYAPNKQRPRSCWSKVTFTPTSGKLLIFPSWLYHGVAPNLSTEKGQAGERVVISFNLSQSKIE